MPAQMKNFLDQTGGLWMQGKLVGKVGSVFTSTATQHGGQESTILSTHTVLLHLGFVIVGLPYTFQGQMGVKEVTGGTHTVLRRSQTAMVHASPATTNWPAPASKGVTLRRSRPSCELREAECPIRRPTSNGWGVNFHQPRHSFAAGSPYGVHSPDPAQKEF